MSAIMLIHVLLGAIAIFSGFFALLSKKRQQLHRIAGKVFVFSIVFMSLAGSFIAYQKPEMITVLAGMLTIYFVISSLLTVSNTSTLVSWRGILLTFFSFFIGYAGVYYGYQANNGADNLYDGFSATPYYSFGIIALIAAISDLKILIHKNIVGIYKIARHAWRMSFALLIATSSLFDGSGAKAFPDMLQGSPFLLFPQIIVLILLIYWIVRILYFKKIS